MPAWFIEWAESVNLWEALLLIGAITGAIWGLVVFIRKGWPWLKSFAKAILNTAELIDSVKGLPEFIERTDATLAAQDQRIGEIHHEVHFNNGSSVKDAVKRVEDAISTEILPTLQVLADTDEQLRRDLEDTRDPD